MHLPERTARSPWGLARRDPQRRSRSSFRQCSVIEAREDDPSAGEGVGWVGGGCHQLPQVRGSSFRRWFVAGQKGALLPLPRRRCGPAAAPIAAGGRRAGCGGSCASRWAQVRGCSK
eukprot:gene18912-biopygen17453